jgi:hypothetical protein
VTFWFDLIAERKASLACVRRKLRRSGTCIHLIENEVDLEVRSIMAVERLLASSQYARQLDAVTADGADWVVASINGRRVRRMCRHMRACQW